MMNTEAEEGQFPLPLDVFELVLIEFSGDLEKTLGEFSRRSGIPGELAKRAIQLTQCRFREVLSSKEGCGLSFDADIVKENESVETFVDRIKRRIHDFIGDDGSEFHWPKQLIVLISGIASLCIFLQSNFTGPLPNQFHQKRKKGINKNMMDFLSVDGESVMSHMIDLEYFVFARLLVQRLLFYKDFESIRWWWARILFLHQRLLVDVSGTLKEEIFHHYNALGGFLDSRPYYLTMAYLELSLVHNFYKDFSKAHEILALAKTQSGLQAEVTGKKGFRTKAQTKPTAQLYLNACSDIKLLEHQEKSCDIYPKQVPLDDDNILENIKFVDVAVEEEDKFVHGELCILDCALLVALCLDVENTNSSHGIVREQMLPYIDRVLLTPPKSFLVVGMALLIKVRLEKHEGKTLGRAVSQIQALVNSLSLEQVPEEEDRLAHFFMVPFPSIGDLKRELAQFLLMAGQISQAIPFFKELKMHSEIIECLRITGKVDQAENYIKKLMSKKKLTPELWCILGDITGDIANYDRAWEDSKCRCARAKRSIGHHFYRQKKYSESIKPFEDALAINPLHTSCWYALGAAYMHINDLDRALLAYRRVVQQESEDGEAWCNVAAILIKQKEKRQAFGALTESLKYKREDWKIWLNFLYVSVDLGEFDHAINSFIKVLDFAKSGIDLAVLTVLVKVVIHNISDCRKMPGVHFFDKLMDVFNHKNLPDTPSTLYLKAELEDSVRGNKENAKKYMSTAIGLCETTEDSTKASVNWLKIAEIAFDLRKIDAALHFAHRISENKKILDDLKVPGNPLGEKLITRCRSLIENIEEYKKSSSSS